MASGFSLNSVRKRHGRAVRAVAVLFLIYTGADLAMPQYFCGSEEMGGLSPNSSHINIARSERNEALVAALTSSDESQPGQPSDEAPHDEDCFCCCAHILPSLSLSIVHTSELRSPSALLFEDSHLSPPLRNTYRPPRFA